MEPLPKQNERRKHPRYHLPELVIAIPNKTKPQVARIVNVSKGGMAVRYVDQDNWLGDAGEVDIFVNSDFFLNGIPIECVRDFDINNQVSFSIMHERQCCLQFKDLTPAQESLLDEFIMKHTAGSS